MFAKKILKPLIAVVLTGAATLGAAGAGFFIESMLVPTAAQADQAPSAVEAVEADAAKKTAGAKVAHAPFCKDCPGHELYVAAADEAEASAAGDSMGEEDAPASRPLEEGELRNPTDPISGEPTSAEHFVAYEDNDEMVYARIYFANEESQGEAEAMSEAELRELYTETYLTQADGTVADYGETVMEVENDHCPVSGSPAGRTEFINYNAAKIYFCCPGCDQEFLSDPDRYLHNVNYAIDEARAEADTGAADSDSVES